MANTYPEVFFWDATPRAISKARNLKLWRAPDVGRACVAKMRKEGRRGEHNGDRISHLKDSLVDDVQHCTVDQDADINEGGVPSLWL